MAERLVSATFRGDVLFIHYPGTETLLGTLYSINTNPHQSPWASRAAVPHSSKGVGSPPPFYYYTKQHISPGPGRSINTIIQSRTAVSMVSTSSSDPSVKGARHDLLLAFKSAQIGPSTMVRLVPKWPNVGAATEEGAISWLAMTEDEDSVLSPTDTSQLWIASGGTSSLPGTQEGSIVYRLATGNGTSVIAQTIDVSRKNTLTRSSSNLLGSLLIPSVSSAVTPKVLSLRDGGMYDAVVVGQCATTTQGTCLVFFNNKSQTMVQTTTTATPEYDPSACLATDDGVIIMATPTQMWTFKYSPESALGPSGAWSARSIKGLKTQSILACAAKDSTAFAVVEGTLFIPSLKSLDFGSALDLTWETMEMFDGSGDSYNHGPAPSRADHDGGLSSQTIAIIVVVILAVIVAAGLFWRRRSRSKAFQLKMSDAAASLPQSTSRQPPEGPANSIPLQPVNRSAQHVVVPGLGSGIEARSGQGSGSGSGTGPGVPRAHSWSQSTSMGPTSDSAAAFSNRASFPYPATSNTGEFYSRPGQQLPIIATSLSAAPYKPFVISSSPIITPNSPSRRGDKDELDQNGQVLEQTSHEAGSSSNSNAIAASSGTNSYEGSSSVAGPLTTSPNTFYPSSAGESSRSYRNSRPMHEMMSPTLANAQRILQQSQEHGQPR
ncbi:hypothetical protein BGZ72_006651 [Mortierella alpina]|nr:hypothetical protein BGZ72_006651 [Mortierella alpina]